MDLAQDLCNQIKLISITVFGFIFFICNIIFLFKKIISVSRLKNKTPIIGKIEDFMLIGYTDDGRRKYNVYPIVRSNADSKLFLTYGDYSLANLNTNISYMNNKIQNVVIYGEKRKELSIGDTAYVYILKKINKPIKIRDDKLKLDNKFIPFLHFNESFQISNFKNITIFKGITTV